MDYTTGSQLPTNIFLLYYIIIIIIILKLYIIILIFFYYKIGVLWGLDYGIRGEGVREDPCKVAYKKTRYKYEYRTERLKRNLSELMKTSAKQL